MTATETAPAASAPAASPDAGDAADAFAVAARAVDDATSALDDLAPEARDAAVALKDAVEAFHRPALVEIVQAGDEVDGEIVSEVRMSTQALSGDELALLLRFEDASSGIYVVTIPEPGTAPVVTLGLLALSRRPRR